MGNLGGLSKGFMKATTEDKLARRFNEIGVQQSDLPNDVWRLFFEEGAVLSVEWKVFPHCSEKTIRLLKEMPKP